MLEELFAPLDKGETKELGAYWHGVEIVRRVLRGVNRPLHFLTPLEPCLRAPAIRSLRSLPQPEVIALLIMGPRPSRTTARTPSSANPAASPALRLGGLGVVLDRLFEPQEQEATQEIARSQEAAG